MNSSNSKSTHETAAHFGISKATLCRWVACGCPHQKIGNRQIFCLREVEEWVDVNMDPESKKSNRLKSRRRLKVYHVFSVTGYYEGEVLGGKALINRLKSSAARDHHYPFGVDDTGHVYFLYSGKLRKHDSVKTMAGVMTHTHFHDKIQPLMDIVYRRYMIGNFRLNNKPSGGISSP